MQRALDPRTIMLCAVMLGATGTVRSQTRPDAIDTLSGSLRATVVSSTRDTIAIDGRDGKKSLAVNEIRRIVFRDEPSSLKTARDALEGNQYANALESLDKIDTGEIQRDVVKQEVEFFRAYARAKKGDAPSQAVKEMLRFAREHQSSYRFYGAMEVLGDLAMQLGMYSTAVKYYGELGKAPWPEYKLRAKVLEAGAWQAQGPEQYPASIKLYGAVVGAKTAAPGADRQKQLALAGKASCDAELGDTQEALGVVLKIIEANDPQDIELFARAYNALGACYRKSNKPKDAVHAYLHVDLLCHRCRSAHAEALYYLSDLWSQVGKADRAVEARKRLKAQYAETTWASR